MSHLTATQVYTQGTGTFSTNPFITVFAITDPSSSAINYPVQKRWLNTATHTEWILASFDTSNGSLTANWIELAGGSASTETLTGNSGGAVGPTDNNINVRGDGVTINIIGDPSTSTLTANLISPLQVLYGGTGDISFIPYSVVCGGTASTNPLQSVASLGTSGQFLTSQGNGSLPHWTSGTSTSFTVNVQKFTTSGLYTPTVNMKYCIVECLGGGGGGGAAIAVSLNSSCGGGGGASGYGKSVFSAATIGVSQTVTIGAGGAGGTSMAGPGSAGGTTNFGALITVTGGDGGASYNGAEVVGTAGGGGGSSTGSDTNVEGTAGSAGFCFYFTDAGINVGVGGQGASSIYGVGGQSVVINSSSAQAAGISAQGYGSGGGGAAGGINGGSVSGGSGSPGYVIITEFIS